MQGSHVPQSVSAGVHDNSSQPSDTHPQKHTRLLLPSGLQLPVCAAPEMPTARPQRASALAALGYASDSGV